MSFESLSYLYEIAVPDFPTQWVPLTHLYDPDLPLFPLHYFHELDPDLGTNRRPGYSDRVYGFIQNFSLGKEGLTARIAVNKDLRNSSNERFLTVAQLAVRERLGLGDPVKLEKIQGAFINRLSAASELLEEIWYQVADQSFGRALPFGRMWDPVFGLARFIASWNSEGGRKGELIQTHYFCSEFGEKISISDKVQGDYYLLPTFSELTDTLNPLSLFPKFKKLASAASEFCLKYCKIIPVGNQKFSAFDAKSAKINGVVNTEKIQTLMNSFLDESANALFQNYNAFNRGPVRSIISLLMLNDIRNRNWEPQCIDVNISSLMYTELSGSYQTPKVIQLYLQQCFGIKHVFPIDNWMKTFLSYPFDFGNLSKRDDFKELFESCSNLAEIERLIWLASQARKVHSSVATDILWCVRYGDQNKKLRGANPFSCKICKTHIRDKCPSYKSIEKVKVVFNQTDQNANYFNISTSMGNSIAIKQTFKSVELKSKQLLDQYSTKDRPNKFSFFPKEGVNLEDLTVARFIEEF